MTTTDDSLPVLDNTAISSTGVLTEESGKTTNIKLTVSKDQRGRDTILLSSDNKDWNASFTVTDKGAVVIKGADGNERIVSAKDALDMGIDTKNLKATMDSLLQNPEMTGASQSTAMLNIQNAALDLLNVPPYSIGDMTLQRDVVSGTTKSVNADGTVESVKTTVTHSLKGKDRVIVDSSNDAHDATITLQDNGSLRMRDGDGNVKKISQEELAKLGVSQDTLKSAIDRILANPNDIGSAQATDFLHVQQATMNVINAPATPSSPMTSGQQAMR